jgi:hypothetical protein
MTRLADCVLGSGAGANASPLSSRFASWRRAARKRSACCRPTLRNPRGGPHRAFQRGRRLPRRSGVADVPMGAARISTVVDTTQRSAARPQGSRGLPDVLQQPSNVVAMARAVKRKPAARAPVDVRAALRTALAGVIQCAGAASISPESWINSRVFFRIGRRSGFLATLRKPVINCVPRSMRARVFFWLEDLSYRK